MKTSATAENGGGGGVGGARETTSETACPLMLSVYVWSRRELTLTTRRPVAGSALRVCTPSVSEREPERSLKVRVLEPARTWMTEEPEADWPFSARTPLVSTTSMEPLVVGMTTNGVAMVASMREMEYPGGRCDAIWEDSAPPAEVCTAAASA